MPTYDPRHMPPRTNSALLRAVEGVCEVSRSGEQRRPLVSRRLGKALDRAGDADGGQDPPAFIAYRGGDRRNPGLALAKGLGPAASPNSGEIRRSVGSAVEDSLPVVRVKPSGEYLGGGAGLHGKRGSQQDGVMEPTGWFGRRDADPALAGPPVDLCALAGAVPQCGDGVLCFGAPGIQAGSPLRDLAAQDEASFGVTVDQSVALQCQGQPMSRWPGQSGRVHQSGEGARTVRNRLQDDDCLVNNPDTARLVHLVILTSHYLRRQVD